MKFRTILLLACTLIVCGCSKHQANDSTRAAQAAPTSASISAFPATLEGSLSIGVSNDWGYFGDINAAGIEYPVAIPGSLFEASGMPDTGGNVRLVVESKQDNGNSFQYMVSSITKL